MNIQQYLTPENITLASGIAGGVVALALLGLAIWNRRTISKGVTSLWRNTFSQGGLFYFGMGLFMLASVVEAGPVLNKIAMHGALFGYGGQMLVFAFDMISAVSLRARLNARRVFDTRGMKLQMWGICLPAAVSVSANLAGSLQSFNANDFNHLFLFAWLLPLIGAVFPSMIIVLSLAADHLIDTTAVNVKLDPEDFKKQEMKRVAILKVRLETEQELLQEESKVVAIRSARDQAQKKTPAQEWFFMHWLRPHTTPPMTAIKAEIEKAVNEARTAQEQQANALASTLSGVQQTLATITDQLQQFTTFRSQFEQVASTVEGQHQQFTTFRSQFEQVASTVEHLTTSLEALKVKHISPSHEGSTRREGSGRAKVLNLHTVASASSGSHRDSLHLQETGEMNPSKKDRAFLFIAEYRRKNEGAEPSLEEIMEAVPCSQGSASNYRSDYRKTQEVQTDEVAALVGATNGHH